MNEAAEKVRTAFLQQGFLPVIRESYPLFKSYESDNLLQEKSAVITTAWSRANSGIYKVFHGYLCNVFFYDACPVYFVIHRSPEIPDYSLQQIIDILYNVSLELALPFLQVRCIEDRFLGEYEKIEGYTIQTEYQVNDNEYAYPVRDLLELSGTANYYKRKRYKKFLTIPGISLRPMTRNNVHLCTPIQNEWCSFRKCADCNRFCGCERDALEIMMRIFDETVHLGLLLYQGEQPVGYIISEKMNERIAYLYFGKSNLADGFVYLTYMIVKEYLHDVEFVNLNDEMGHAGLRQFKTHLSAHELWRRNICTFTKAPIFC